MRYNLQYITNQKNKTDPRDSCIKMAPPGHPEGFLWAQAIAFLRRAPGSGGGRPGPQVATYSNLVY